MTAKNISWFALRVFVLIGVALLVRKAVAGEPPPPPIVHLLAADPCAAEAGADTATFAVIRIGPTNGPLTVHYRLGGTAENGVDYRERTGEVTIPANAEAARIIVTPIDDSLVEGTETIFIELVQPLSWPPPYIVCWPSFAFGHIEDNDLPPTNRPPAVELINPPDGSVFIAPVDLTLVARASDSDGRVRTVEFFADGTSLGIVTNRPPIHPIGPVAIGEDDPILLGEPDSYVDLEEAPGIEPIPIRPGLFRLVWENVPPGHHVLTAVATDNLGASATSARVEIRVTDAPSQPVVEVKATDPEATEPGPTGSRLDTATFVVHRSGGTDLPLTVFYRLSGTAGNGVDYRELPHSVTIPRGERGAEVVIAPIDDNLVEGDEKVGITILPPICIAIFPPPPDCYLVGRHHEARAVIHDNDTPPNRPPVVQIVRPLDGSVFLAPATIGIAAQARDYDGRVVSVEFFEGANSLGIVSNNPAALTASLPAFHLVWSNVPPGHYVLHALATDNDGAASRSRPVEIKVVERTEPPVVTIAATDAEAAEVLPPGTPNPATFSVSRSGGTERPLVVYYSVSGSASNGVDYRALTGRVTIPQGAVSAPIVIEPVDDRLVEGVETVGITIEPPICIAIHPQPPDCYRVGANDAARAIIRDNDLSPTNQPPKVAIIRPENGDVFVAPADITIYAEARDADGSVRTVEFFTNGISLGVVSNNLSALPIGNTTVVDPQQIFRLHWPGVFAGLYVLTAKATDNRGAMTVSEPVRIKVIEPELPPIVTIEATDPYASEGDLIEIAPHPTSPSGGVAFIGPPIPIFELPNTATFTVRRSGGTNLDLVVYYDVAGTAANGVDYTRLSGQVTIPRGSWKTQIVVIPTDDTLVEDNETVIVTIVPIACPRIVPSPPECYLVGEPNRAVAFIRDNDLNLSPRVEIVQPADGETFPAGADITIAASTRDRDGYVTKVEFYAGTNKIGEQEMIFIIAPPPGQVQRFSMNWSNASAGEHRLSAVATDDSGAMSRSDGVLIKVIERTRIPVVTIETTDKVAAEQSPLILSPPDHATLRVSRTGDLSDKLTVYYRVSGTASNGVDYRPLSGEVTILESAASAEIVIVAIDDNLVEDTETVVVALESSPHCLATDPPSRGCYLIGLPGRDLAYIRDNDVPPNRPPAVALVNPPDGSVLTAPVDVRLVASASDSDGWVATVAFFDGTNSLGIVHNHPQVLDPVLLPDGDVDALTAILPRNPFVLVWSNAPPGEHRLSAVATDNDGASTRSPSVSITIVELPEPTIVNIIARDPKASEGPRLATAADIAADTATFVVTRRGPTNETLVVHFRIGGTALNGVDYRELANAVRIPAGESSAPIVVVPIDDNLVEGAESVVLSLVAPPCIAIWPPPPDCYEVGRNHTARAVIYDNDEPPNEPPGVRLVEPEDGDVFLAPADIKLVAKAGDSDGTVVLVEFFEGTNKVAMATGPSEDGLYYARWVAVPAGHYVLTAVATDNRGATAESEPHEIKVVERQPPPVVNIAASDPEGREVNPLTDQPENPAAFTVTRTGLTNNPLVVYLRIGGTASNGEDYEYLRAHVTIPAGASRADVVVEILDDALCEGDESVIVGLVSHPCIAEFPPPRDCYLVGPNSRARAVIHDNDVCLPNQPPRVAIVRPANDDVFEAPADIVIYAEARDADGRVLKVEFYEGTNSIGAARTDFSNTQDIFRILWENVPAGGYVLTAVATDDDGASTRSEPVHIRVIERPTRPVVYITAVDPVGSEEGDTATFQVWRSCCTNAALTVLVEFGGTASNAVDYGYRRGHATIPAGEHATRILIEPIDDPLVEGTETVVARLLPTPCAESAPQDCYVIGHYYQATAYIRDNDSVPNVPPRVALLSPSEGEVFSAPADIELLAVTLDPDGWVTQVQFCEGTNVIGGLAILVSEPPPHGELQTFRFNWDGVAPGRYILTAKATDNRGATTVSGPIHITVLDRCVAPVVTITALDAAASEPDPRSLSPVNDVATFIVRRTCGLARPLLVYYEVGGTADDGRDYVRLPGEVLIPAGEDSARIVVNPIDDDLVERTETVVVELTQIHCINSEPIAPDCYLVGRPNRAVANIRDNDTYPPRVAIVSPADGAVFDAPGNIPVMAEALDPDGWVPLVEFFEGANKIGEASIHFIVAPPPGQRQFFTIRWTSVPAGRYVLTAVATDDRGATSRSAPIHVTFEPPSPTPVVNIVATDPLACEATGNTATFRIRRTGPTNDALTVHYSIHGMAMNGIDYDEIPTSVTIPAGRRAARILITPVPDKALERRETVILRLQPSPVDPPRYAIGRPARAGALIVDDCTPRPHPQRLDDGCFHVRLPGDNGVCYRLEVSTDLLRWEPLVTNVVTDDGIHFVDDEMENFGLRFYRVMPEVEVLDEE